MASWNCASCGEVIDFGFETCWNCGAQQEGSPVGADAAIDNLPTVAEVAQSRSIDCLRCQSPMLAIGRRKFHEGSLASGLELGDFGELFANREGFDVYGCNGCGKIEFFLVDPAG